MRQANTTVLPSTTADTTNSAAINTENILYISVQAIATGTLAGAVKIQVSNDVPVAANAVPTNWNDLSGATVTLTGTAGSFIIPKTDLCYQWVRLVFTKSGGTGTVTVNIKTIGA